MTDRLQALLAWQNEQQLSLTELAKQLGFDLGYMSRIIQGKRPVGDALIGRFFAVYGPEVTARVFKSQSQEYHETPALPIGNLDSGNCQECVA